MKSPSARPVRTRLARVSSCVCTVALALAALLALPTSAVAQVLYGSIVGNVIDSTGAGVPGATVTIEQAETKLTRELVADAAGAYHFTAVPSGTYNVTVTMNGFRTFSRRDVPVTLNSTARVDAKMEVGQLTETVSVSAETPLLQTDRAEVRAELNTRQLTELPVPIGRNYQQLFKTLPGFTPPADAHSIPSNPSRALVFNVNGASDSSNNTRIDGVSTTNVWLPHVAAYVPALESLETVNVVTNSFDAEQGLAGGSAINVQIKSGTNQLRGSGYEYYTNEQMRELNYFSPAGTSKGDWAYHQYGATLGGPILRNKLFYFGSYESTRDKQNATRTISVPTEALRRGDLSGSVNPIYDPATGAANGTGRTPFAGNIIPQNRIDPTASKIIGLLPLPNLPGETNNYFVAAPFEFNRWTLDTKVNWNATPKLNIFGRYSHLDFWTFNEAVYGDTLQGVPIAGGNPGTGQGYTANFSAGATYSFTPSLVADAHFGYVRMYTDVAHTDIGQNKGMDLLGIPGLNGPRAFEGGMPVFDFNTYQDIGITELYMPYTRNDDQYQTVVNVNWSKGKHNVRAGTDIYFQALNHLQPETTGDNFGARGGFRYGTGPTQLNGGPSGTMYNAWGAFLLGLPDQLGRLNLTVAPYATRMRSYSFYLRDNWQVTNRLTLAYGTRYEYFPMPTRDDRGLERYNPDTGMMEIGGVGSVPTDIGIKMEKGLFAPRVGLTFRASPSMVLRGGFGITNDPYSLARPMRTNHPILLNLIVNAPNSFGWAGRTADGVPPVPNADLGNGIITIPSNVSAVTIPSEFNRGYIKSWNAAIQKELKWGFVAEAAYVATRQIDQLGFLELNWSPIGGGQAGRQLNQKFGRTAQTRLVAPVGDTKYDALQARLDRRFANGIQLGVGYTLSKAMGIAGAPRSDGVPRIMIPEYYYLNTAIQSFDRTHNLQITNLTELPFGPGRRWLHGGGVLPAIVGGWQINNIISITSGTPFDITASGTSLNAPESSQRADQVKSDVQVLHGIGRGNAWFDPFAFAPVTEARFGTAPWGAMRGPGYANWDLGVFRQFDMRRNMNVQFRFEAFNVLNTAHFNNPGGNVSNLQLNPDGTVRNLNGFSEVTTSFGERQMRVGVRFGW
jgi:Carboxypeptidase regulatory-like domain/TonB dependent receptor-like, beta-barrel